MDRPAGARIKKWGWTQLLFEQKYLRSDGSEAVQARIERIHIDAGGYSSIHRHHQQANTFYVHRGILRLREFVLDGQVPVEVSAALMQADDHPVTFLAGDVHQFEALTDVEALEIYVAVGEGDASGADIERFSENGMIEFGKLDNGIAKRALANMSEDQRRLPISGSLHTELDEALGGQTEP